MRWIERWRPCKKWNAIAQRIRKVRPRRAGLDCRFAAAHLSHYWALLLERESPASATAPRRRCALSTCNIPGLSGRLLTEINIAEEPANE